MAAGMVAVVVMMVVDRRLVGDLDGSVSSLSKAPPAKWALMLVLCTFLQFDFRCLQFRWCCKKSWPVGRLLVGCQHASRWMYIVTRHDQAF